MEAIQLSRLHQFNCSSRQTHGRSTPLANQAIHHSWVGKLIPAGGMKSLIGSSNTLRKSLYNNHTHSILYDSQMSSNAHLRIVESDCLMPNTLSVPIIADWVDYKRRGYLLYNIVWSNYCKAEFFISIMFLKILLISWNSWKTMVKENLIF